MCLLSNLNSLAKPQEPRIMQFSSLFPFIFCFQTKSFNGKILENKLKIHKIYIGKSPFTFFGTQFKCIYADEANWKRVLVGKRPGIYPGGTIKICAC